MSSENNDEFRSKNSKLAENCTQLEKDTRLQRDKLNECISSCSTPVLDLPQTILQLQDEGRNDDIPKLNALVRGLARDIDALIKKRNIVDQTFDEIVKDRPTKLRHLSDYHGRLMSVGGRYLALNQQAFQTVMRDFDDYLDLTAPAGKKAVKSKLTNIGVFQ